MSWPTIEFNQLQNNFHLPCLIWHICIAYAALWYVWAVVNKCLTYSLLSSLTARSPVRPNPSHELQFQPCFLREGVLKHHPQLPWEQNSVQDVWAGRAIWWHNFQIPAGICSCWRSSESFWWADLDTQQLRDSRCLMAVKVCVLPVASYTSACIKTLSQYFFYRGIYLYNNNIKLQCWRNQKCDT